MQVSELMIEGVNLMLLGMGSVFLLMAIIFYIGAVMATKLFGDSFPDWFGSLALSAYSLFQIMTLESWSMGIVRPVMEVYPLAWVFFVPFVIVTSFAVLNLFIGILVNTMQARHEEERRQELEGMESAAQDERAVIVESIVALRADVAALREEDMDELVCKRQ